MSNCSTNCYLPVPPLSRTMEHFSTFNFVKAIPKFMSTCSSSGSLDTYICQPLILLGHLEKLRQNVKWLSKTTYIIANVVFTKFFICRFHRTVRRWPRFSNFSLTLASMACKKLCEINDHILFLFSGTDSNRNSRVHCYLNDST